MLLDIAVCDQNTSNMDTPELLRGFLLHFETFTLVFQDINYLTCEIGLSAFSSHFTLKNDRRSMKFTCRSSFRTIRHLAYSCHTSKYILHKLVLYQSQAFSRMVRAPHRDCSSSHQCQVIIASLSDSKEILAPSSKNCRGELEKYIDLQSHHLGFAFRKSA